MFCLKRVIFLNKLGIPVCRRFISVLYMSGDKAKENYVPLAPYMNFKKRLGEIHRLRENISRRSIELDLDTFIKKYEIYSQLEQNKSDLEKRRERIADEIKQLGKDGDEATVSKLKAQAIALRTELKALRESIYPIEDDFIRQYLSLPNELHDRCPPTSEEMLIYRSGLPKDIPTRYSHLNRTDLIRFIDKGCYYLMDEAAEFELESSHLCRDMFIQNNFISTVNPDFTRRVLIEAKLTPPEQYHCVMEEDQRHHLNTAFLTGGGSFESFLGHLTKLSIYPSVLPLRLVSMGREYKVKKGSSEYGLYTATQSNVVQTLVASRSKEDADQQMDDILNLAVDFYKKLGVHFRIVFKNTSSLTRAEALRASIELYSQVNSKYFEVGHVSHYLDFVSERILFNAREGKKTKFLHLVGGPIVTTSVLIANLIECDLPLTASWQINQTNQVEVFKSLFKA